MRGRQKRLDREMAELAVLGSPGPFKARKKDPERMLADFNLYVKSIKNLLTLTDNTEATDAKKKALMQSVGGPDMIWLFDYVGKVADGDTYAAAIEKVKTAITGQTNQAVMKYKLFTGMPQGEQAFASWWTNMKEQAEKCDFTVYNKDSAARDAILFQTSNAKLRKRILAEDYSLEETVKIGLAYKHSDSKAKVMDGSKLESEVSRIQQLENQVARLQADRKTGKPRFSGNKQEGSLCQTCPDSSRHRAEGQCQGKNSKECFACGKSGHFKGAPLCKGDNKKEAKQKWKKPAKSRRVQEPPESEEDTESGETDSDSVPRLKESSSGETVAAAKETEPQDPMVEVGARPRQGAQYKQVKWLADSGVRKTLMAEADWRKMAATNPKAKLVRNKIRFTPYGTKVNLEVIG